MDDVRIVLTAPRTPLGAIIRLVTRSRVSHCLIEIPVWDKRMVAEARIGGVRLVPMKRAQHHVVQEFVCQFETRKGLIAIADTLGGRYDYAGLVVIAWWLVIRQWFKVKCRRTRYRSESVKCSELVAMFLRACNVSGAVESLPSELATPEDIRAFCMAHPVEFRELVAVCRNPDDVAG
jgi:hypothetical protein